MTHQFIYSPAESTTRFIEYVNYLYDTPGIKFGIPSIDKRVLPMRPGEVIGITGRPGHGKTSLQTYLAMQVARQIIERQAKNKIVLFVTWEQTIEVQEAFFQSGLAMNQNNGYSYSISDLAWGKADKEKVIEKAVKSRVWNPIWVAGRSLHDANKQIPPMFVDTLFENIENLKTDFGVTPSLICFDYLQRIPVKRGDQRNLQVAEAILNTSELAKSVAAPTLLNVQAKAEVDNRGDKIPNMGDTYYTAELSHVVDKHFGLMKPIKYHNEGEIIKFNFGGLERDLTVNDRLLIIQLDKQRMEQGKWRFAVRFDMSQMEIHDYDFVNDNRDFG